jgi:hypothetical protein
VCAEAAYLKHAEPTCREHGQPCAVLELDDGAWTRAPRVEPVIPRGPQRGVPARQQDGQREHRPQPRVGGQLERPSDSPTDGCTVPPPTASRPCALMVCTALSSRSAARWRAGLLLGQHAAVGVAQTPGKTEAPRACARGASVFFGSPTWARTRDLRINSPSLYRLSYRGIAFKYSVFRPTAITEGVGGAVPSSLAVPDNGGEAWHRTTRWRW